MANRRALSTIFRFWLAASVQKIPFQSAIAWSCQKIAASVWSAVRLVLVSEPSSLTSLKSSAYSTLVRAFGPSVRSISALGMMNGSTFPTHAAGSFRKFGGVGRQIPGGAGDGYGVGVGPKRPSFMRAVSIALAVAAPIAIPAAFDPGGCRGELLCTHRRSAGASRPDPGIDPREHQPNKK